MKHTSGRLFVGLAFILIGLAFVVKNLNLFPWEFEYYFLSWPSLLIVIGLFITITERGSFFGFSLLLVGAIFVTSRYYDYPAGEIFSDLWPLFIIFFGMSILLGHRKGRHGRSHSGSTWIDYSDDTLDISTFFGENKRRITSQNFSKAKITTSFGSTVLDFTNAKVTSNCNVTCDTVFGGTELIIPSSWMVVNKGTALFGGTGDERRKSAPIEGEEPMKITVNGFTMFGGIEIKS